MRHRIELITATVHWAHTEAAIELVVSPEAGGRARVDITVSQWGDYWERCEEPRIARFALVGALTLCADRCVITLDRPAPVQRIELDPRVPNQEIFSGPGLAPKVPDFCAPLLAWADAQKPEG